MNVRKIIYDIEEYCKKSGIIYDKYRNPINFDKLSKLLTIYKLDDLHIIVWVGHLYGIEQSNHYPDSYLSKYKAKTISLSVILKIENRKIILKELFKND
jgi:hypothetical protein